MPAQVTQDVQLAADLLRRGQLVAIPTETVYGLGANALDPSAAASIFSAKGRPAFDPLIIHQASAERLFAFASDVPAAARKLATAFWPGPLTLVLRKDRKVPDLVTAGLSTVAMRVPDHPLTLRLLEGLDFPLAAPSANPFGFVSPTRAGHVMDQLGEKIAGVLDGGPCRVGLESTIIGFPDGVATVYRKGGLPIEEIEAVLGQTLAVREHSSSQPEAPGMLSKHYSPGCKIHLVTDLEKVISGNNPAKKKAYVGFGHFAVKEHLLSEERVWQFDLSPAGSLEVAATQLFSVLRRLNAERIDETWVQILPERGLGRAINDRLRRAAAS
ncbi:L-threonylcarbamoyladenylate synthase [Lewinella sp. 4G2]|uniref:L-threonylcarbamoyladenylate synthase n=1 Tax=Lewinella sp. 4G2 TaxID=1803372 RepID=UPI0007B4D570|nr:L-threonylcarbamoyladenylate synthase [Lewinella sp. 4G2]OAV45598.1 threonylcarbamoyl-AMP synthase [Lewinella sp. 4G2]